MIGPGAEIAKMASKAVKATDSSAGELKITHLNIQKRYSNCSTVIVIVKTIMLNILLHLLWLFLTVL